MLASRRPRFSALPLALLLGSTLTAAPLAAQPEPREATTDEDAGEKTLPSDKVAPDEVVSKEGGTTVAAKGPST